MYLIQIGQLKHRDYDENKNCISFQYLLNIGRGEDGKDVFHKFYFEKVEDYVWKLTTKIGRTDHSDSQMFEIAYKMPRNDLPLVLICATGLRYFGMHIKNEIQYRSLIDFAIGQVTEGM